MIRIILVDDHAVVRNGYRRLLDAEPGLQVVGEAASADEANALALRIAAGKRVFSPENAQVLAAEAIDGDGALDHLTPREFEVLRMLVHGQSASGIASSMHRSPKIVLNYLTLIRQKLDADNDFNCSTWPPATAWWISITRSAPESITIHHTRRPQ